MSSRGALCQLSSIHPKQDSSPCLVSLRLWSCHLGCWMGKGVWEQGLVRKHVESLQTGYCWLWCCLICSPAVVLNDRIPNLRAVKVPPVYFLDRKLKFKEAKSPAQSHLNHDCPQTCTRCTGTRPVVPYKYWFTGPVHIYSSPTMCQIPSESY